MRLAELPSSRSLIGVAVAVAGNVTISLALNCQKLAHLHLQHRRQSKDQDQDQDQDQDGDRDGNRDGNEDPDTLALPHHDLMVPNQSSSSSLSGNKQTDIDHDETLAQDRGSSSPASGSGSSMSPSNGTNTDFLKSKLWWLGIALMTLGEAGNFICESRVVLPPQGSPPASHTALTPCCMQHTDSHPPPSSHHSAP